MSSVSSLVTRLESGAPALSAWCGLPHPAIAGLLAREAFDAITLDMQHGAIDFAAVVQAIPLVAAAGKPTLARVPVGDFGTASRLVDAGAAGVIAPMINSAADARRFAAAVKYPPVGERSWGPHAGLALSGLQPADYFRQANGFSLSFAMIETREALAAIDDILAVPGIDAIFIGPSDLSIALSGGALVNPESAETEEALDHAKARARAAGKLIAVYGPTGEKAADFIRRGFDLVAVASDGGMLRAGAEAMIRAARA